MHRPHDPPPLPCGNNISFGPAPPVVNPDLRKPGPILHGALVESGFVRAIARKEDTMKSPVFNTRCFPGNRAAMPAAQRAHTPARYQTGAVRLAEAAPPPQYCDTDGVPDSVPRQRRGHSERPQVLLIDMDAGAAVVVRRLLTPEAEVTHAATLAEARRLLSENIFSLIMLDPALPDGDARVLLPSMGGTPLIVYSAHQPEWRGAAPTFLPKPWTTARQLWVAVAGLLGIASTLAAED